MCAFPYLIALPILLLPVAAFAVEPEPIEETSESFESHGKKIAVDRFAPKTPGKHPAVVILHGSGGLQGRGGYDVAARGLARRGYVALIPHYFDRTGTTIALPKTMKDEFTPWMETVADTVGFAAGRAEVDAAKIGLVGFSLGGYLSLSTATHDPRIKVIVDYFGGLPKELHERAGKLPPTLILHGDADPIVPVHEAHTLEGLLKTHKILHEVKIYPGLGHGFSGTTGDDAARRALAFLDTHLKT
ncbi:MAG: dienelactone hydrolase [Planctomycetota bacterium]|nr:dienelactone hydrolase [Planctomycetota bacterium]